MDDLVAAGAAAIMVSAVDPKNPTEGLNTVAKQVPLFTTDSDAPQSNRIAYIGSSNTDLGKEAGELMLKALPNGGKCIGFVGLLGADNARERIEGMKEVLEGLAVELVDVRGDEIDQTRAKRNVEDTLAANPDITCLVGFYSYNTAADLRGAEGSRQARPDQGHRLRRGSDHAWRRQGRLHRRHGRPAALRVGLSGHEADGQISREATSPGSRPTGSSSFPAKVIDQSNVDDFMASMKQMMGK